MKLDELFADVAAPNDTTATLNNPRIKEAATSELLAEVLARVVAQERQERTAGPAAHWAARARDPEGVVPERVQFMSADAPSSRREKGSGASSDQHDEAQ